MRIELSRKIAVMMTMIVSLCTICFGGRTSFALGNNITDETITTEFNENVQDESDFDAHLNSEERYSVYVKEGAIYQLATFNRADEGGEHLISANATDASIASLACCYVSDAYGEALFEFGDKSHAEGVRSDRSENRWAFSIICVKGESVGESYITITHSSGTEEIIHVTVEENPETEQRYEWLYQKNVFQKSFALQDDICKLEIFAYDVEGNAYFDNRLIKKLSSSDTSVAEVKMEDGEWGIDTHKTGKTNITIETEDGTYVKEIEIQDSSSGSNKKINDDLIIGGGYYDENGNLVEDEVLNAYAAHADFRESDGELYRGYGLLKILGGGVQDNRVRLNAEYKSENDNILKPERFARSSLYFDEREIVHTGLAINIREANVGETYIKTIISYFGENKSPITIRTPVTVLSHEEYDKKYVWPELRKMNNPYQEKTVVDEVINGDRIEVIGYVNVPYMTKALRHYTDYILSMRVNGEYVHFFPKVKVKKIDDNTLQLSIKGLTSHEGTPKEARELWKKSKNELKQCTWEINMYPVTVTGNAYKNAKAAKRHMAGTMTLSISKDGTKLKKVRVNETTKGIITGGGKTYIAKVDSSDIESFDPETKTVTFKNHYIGSCKMVTDD